MTDARLGIGILGCGKMGAQHAEALARAADARLVAVADRDASVAAALGARWQVPVVDGLRALCADPSVALVVVATPTVEHAAAVRQALSAGKHVLCEKPLAERAADVDDLCTRAAGAERLLAVGYAYRYAPTFRRLRALLADGVLDPPHLAVLRIGGRGGHRAWKHHTASAGGAILDMMSHMVDLVVCLFGAPRRSHLMARATLLPERRIDGRVERVDAEDYAVAELEYPRLRCLIEADLATPGFVQYADLQSANGSVLVSVLDTMPTRLFLTAPRGDFAAGWTVLDDPPADPIDEQWRSLVAEVRGGAHAHWHAEARATAAVLERLRSGA